VIDVAETQGPQIVAIAKPDKNTHVVTHWPVPAGADGGLAIIKQFLADYDSGAVQLNSAITAYSNKDLLALSFVQREMQLRGLK
jgi:hypothetical protein